MNDREAMRIALDAAARAQGTTAPNPTVGAVVLHDGEVLGVGHTQPVGGPHAEVMALTAVRAAGRDPRGATLVVTLEPCCHHGRTPPCVDAILAAGIARVVVGVVDPTEPMRGRSLAKLRAAGVAVSDGVEASACRRSLAGWIRAVTVGLPEVTVKTATSADGAIATRSGESQWITSSEARGAGRLLRATHDAIVVGIGTVLADDPRLTTRIPGATDAVPVVLDTHARFPAGCALDRPETLLYTTEARSDLRATVVPIARERGRVAIAAVLRDLVRRGRHRVLVEGGGEVIRSFLDGGHVDTVEQFVAGLVLPGGRPWVAGEPVEGLADQARWTLHDVRRIGPDAHLTWHVVRE
jgi:diaminohydroxyphosphoribosylaminopyrimidine deaminase/5-amino-6-(5-phosphoribosylamino)uracil reductase